MSNRHNERSKYQQVKSWNDEITRKLRIREHMRKHAQKLYCYISVTFFNCYAFKHCRKWTNCNKILWILLSQLGLFERKAYSSTMRIYNPEKIYPQNLHKNQFLNFFSSLFTILKCFWANPNFIYTHKSFKKKNWKKWKIFLPCAQ